MNEKIVNAITINGKLGKIENLRKISKQEVKMFNRVKDTIAKNPEHIFQSRIFSVIEVGEDFYFLSKVYATPVYIPIGEVIRDEDIAHSNLKMSDLMKRYIGCEIDFMIDEVLDETLCMTAKVKPAREKKFKTHFLGNEKLITVGSAVEVRIVKVDKLKLQIEMFGKLIELPIDEILWKRVETLRDEYAPGERLVIEVTSITYNEIDENDIFKSVDITVSAKSLMPHPFDTMAVEINVGDIYMGKASAFSKKSVFVELPFGCDALCRVSSGVRPPFKGADVLVEITQINEDEKRIYGMVKNVLGRI